MSIAMVLAGGFFLLASWGALGNLFEEYQDSPASTYLLLGGSELLVGALLVWLGFFTLLRRDE